MWRRGTAETTDTTAEEEEEEGVLALGEPRCICIDKGGRGKNEIAEREGERGRRRERGRRCACTFTSSYDTYKPIPGGEDTETFFVVPISMPLMSP